MALLLVVLSVVLESESHLCRFSFREVQRGQ
jgi:hypothetical protein